MGEKRVTVEMVADTLDDLGGGAATGELVEEAVWDAGADGVAVGMVADALDDLGGGAAAGEVVEKAVWDAGADGVALNTLVRLRGRGIVPRAVAVAI